MKYYRAYTKADGEKDYIMDRDGQPLIRSAEDADDALAECPIYVEEL